MKKKNRKRFWISLFLIAAAGTYAVPFMSVSLAGLGRTEYSFGDLARFLPKPQAASERPEIDFNSLLKKILKEFDAKKAGKNIAASPRFILAAMIPVALGIAYLSVLLALLLLWTSKLPALKKTLLAAFIASAYVIAEGYHLSFFVKSSIASKATGLFSIFSDTLAKSASVQIESGAYLLAGMIALAFSAALLA